MENAAFKWIIDNWSFISAHSGAFIIFGLIAASAGGGFIYWLLKQRLDTQKARIDTAESENASIRRVKDDEIEYRERRLADAESQIVGLKEELKKKEAGINVDAIAAASATKAVQELVVMFSEGKTLEFAFDPRKSPATWLPGTYTHKDIDLAANTATVLLSGAATVEQAGLNYRVLGTSTSGDAAKLIINGRIVSAQQPPDNSGYGWVTGPKREELRKPPGK